MPQKSVSFNNIYNINKLQLKNNNIFTLFNQCPELEDNNTYFNLLPPLDEIIWGTGFKSLIGVSWADECDE